MQGPARHSDDEPAQTMSVHAVAGVAHDGDDLLDRGRVGAITSALVPGRAADMKIPASWPANDDDRQHRTATAT